MALGVPDEPLNPNQPRYDSISTISNADNEDGLKNAEKMLKTLRMTVFLVPICIGIIGTIWTHLFNSQTGHGHGGCESSCGCSQADTHWVPAWIQSLEDKTMSSIWLIGLTWMILLFALILKGTGKMKKKLVPPKVNKMAVHSLVGSIYLILGVPLLSLVTTHHNDHNSTTPRTNPKERGQTARTSTISTTLDGAFLSRFNMYTGGALEEGDRSCSR